MNTQNDWAGVHAGLILLAGQLGELKQMLSSHPDMRKAVGTDGAKYTAVKHLDLGQGITRTYTVTYTYNSEGILELLDVKVEE